MIDRVERVVRAVARAVDRRRWAARFLGLARDEGDPARPGLLIVQIDGLSRRRLERAVAEGHLPFVRRLLDEEAYGVVPVYSGLPSTTPAVQAELFYGRPVAVPAFAFVDRASGRAFRMYEKDAVTAVEQRFTDRSALGGGASYCNVYAGHAATARFCMATLGPGDLVRTNRPLALPVVAVTHLGDALRAGALAAGELLAALADLPRRLRAGEDVRAELKYVQTRVFVCVLLREALTALASVDLARGLPVVYLNLVGYDEVAHRRGPDSAPAMRSLRPVDRAIARLARAARRSHHRDYEVWVLADHGQELTEPYVEVQGRAVQDAVAEVFRAAGMEAQHVVEPLQGEQHQRVRLLGERLLGLVVPGLDIVTRFRQPGRVFTTAQGSVGHVYAPRPLTADERHDLATALVHTAAVPLVLAADGPGRAVAWTTCGRLALPDDIGRLVDPDHPYAAAVAEDLVALCHHPDAGEQPGPGARHLRSPDAHGELAVPVAVEPPHRPGVAAAVHPLELVDERERLGGGPPAHRRGGMQHPDQLEHVGRRRRQATLEHRAQMLHVGHRDDRRFGLLVEVGAERQQPVVDHVDGDPVFVLVLGRGEQAGGQAGVGAGVAGAGRGAGERMGAHDVADAGHQQLGGRTEVPVDRVQVARPEADAQAAQDRPRVQGTVGLDEHVAGQHDLAQAPGPDGVTGGRHGGAPVVGRSEGVHPEPAAGDPGRLARPRVAAPEPVDHGVPGGAVGRPSPHLGGDQHLARSVGSEREGGEPDRAAASEADLVVDLDARQRLAGQLCGDPEHRSPGRQPGAVPKEQQAVPPGDVEQVEVAPAQAAGDAAHHPTRVAVTSWLMPPDSNRRRTSVNPASASRATMAAGAGR